MKKVAVIGHFAHGLKCIDGQTVKTHNLTAELKNHLGEGQVVAFDTHGSIKTLLKAPFIVCKALRNARNVIMLPAHNGLRVFGRLLPLFGRLYKNKKIFYVVIGGWLPEKLEKSPSLAKALQRFDGVFVETETMKRALEKQSFNNVYVLPNFKKLLPLSERELVFCKTSPLKLCTFSRVDKGKGIETAVNAVHSVNERLGYKAYDLDIYGPIDSNQTEWFEKLSAKFGGSARYCGCIDPDKSVDVLKNYFALLFPTHYYTEGIPGSIIDAYAAGVPVISAKWESFSDIVDEGVTGVGYSFEDRQELESILVNIAGNSSAFNDLKLACLKKSKEYMPSVVIKIVIDRLH